MDDDKTRIVMRSGTAYLVLQPFDEVTAGLSHEFAEFTSVTGQSAFPPERLCVRASEVAVVQACSPEAWIWQQRAAELHYARQLEEVSPQARMATAFENLARGEESA